MGHSRRDPQIIYFADCTLDLQTAELHRNGTRLVLQDQPFKILTALLGTPGQLVTREELIKELWPTGTFVDFDQSLNKAIGRLREALGDSAEKPRFIETLPRKGYRWIGEVSERSFTDPSPIQSNTVVTDEINKGIWPWKRTLLFLLMCGACILTVTWYLRWRRKETAVQVLRPVPVTALPGLAANASLSPDGSHVAFSWTSDPLGSKGVDLYVKRMGSEDAVRLTKHSFDFIASAWSPDGERIAFYGSSKNESGLYVVPTAGGENRKLRSTYPLTQNTYSNIAWSNDGKTIAFAETPPGGHQRLQLLSVETNEVSQIDHDDKCEGETMPAFSHDGNQLAYACFIDSSHFGFSIATSQGRSPHIVKEFDGYTLGVTWSGDDKRLVFSHWQRPFKNDRLQEMTLEDGSVHDFSFSADAPLRDLPLAKDILWPNIAASSRRLVYTMQSGGNEVTVWRADLREPHSPRIKVISSTRRQIFPQYSPDGKYIGFSSNRGGSSEIWISDGKGKNLEQLSRVAPSAAVGLSWSPDSRRIVFDSRKAGHSELYVTGIAERVPRKLNVGTMDACNPSWSHDGKWIYFVAAANQSASQIYRVPADGGHAEAINSAPGYYPTESFDGKGVYFVGVPTSLEFASTHPTGTEYKVEGLPALAFDASWTVTRDGIYFFPAGAADTLSYFDFATIKVRPILTTKGTAFGISVSPDGHYLLYTQMEDVRGDIMVVDDFR